MTWHGDLAASAGLVVFVVAVMLTRRLCGSAESYARVAQQGGTAVLGSGLMNAGYWALAPLVRTCVNQGVSPALLSWLSLGPAVAAGLLVATGHWGFAAWALLASALLDVLDGAVARRAATASAAGAILDSVLDRYAEFALFAGLLAYYRHLPAAIGLCTTALFGSFMITYSTAKAEALQLLPPRGMMKRSDRLAVLIAACVFAPIEMALAPAHRPYAPWTILGGVALIAVLANLSAVGRFHALRHSSRP